MKALLLLAAVASLSTVRAQTSSGPSSTGWSAGNWNAGQFEQRTTDRVVLFPNPATDRVHIAFPGLTGPAVVTLVGGDGRVLRREQVEQTAGTQWIPNLEGLRNGAYLVHVEQEGDRVTKRLVVAH